MDTPSASGSWIPSAQTFGARLALIRWRMQWNIKEAAHECGLNESSWRGWELEGRMPHDLAQVAAAIAERTGASKYWIIDGEGEPTADPEARAPAHRKQLQLA